MDEIEQFVRLGAARLRGLVMHGVMPSVSSERLVLNVLLKGLADATHRNDRLTAERYRRRLHSAAERVADEPVQDALRRDSALTRFARNRLAFGKHRLTFL
jgi:hypothetical protein